MSLTLLPVLAAAVAAPPAGGARPGMFGRVGKYSDGLEAQVKQRGVLDDTLLNAVMTGAPTPNYLRDTAQNAVLMPMLQMFLKMQFGFIKDFFDFLKMTRELQSGASS